MLFKVTLKNLKRLGMDNYKQKKTRVSTGSGTKQLKVVRNMLTNGGSIHKEDVWDMIEVV